MGLWLSERKEKDVNSYNQLLKEIRFDPSPLAIVKLTWFYREADGSPNGSDTPYWLRAEAEVLRARGLPHPEEH